MLDNNITSIETELIRLTKEKDRLARLIASAGKAAPKYWSTRLEEIDTRISSTKRKRKGKDPTDSSIDPKVVKDVEEISHNIRTTLKDIKIWLLTKAGKLLLILLITLIIIAIIHYCLTLIEMSTNFVDENYEVNIEYPYFVSCHEYFVIYICANRKKNTEFYLELQPLSSGLWIKGDKWNKMVDISKVSRNDWRPEILYKPDQPFWKNLYPEKKITVILNNIQGEQIKREILTFRAIRFYNPLTVIVTVLIVILNAHRYRFINVFQKLLVS